MSNIQYYTDLAWDRNIREIGTDADGLAIDAIATTAGAPANTPRRWIPGAFVQNEVDGNLYYNAGTTLAPNFQLVGGGGAGTPSLPFNSIQYNNAGAFFGDTQATRDPLTQQTQIERTLTTFDEGLFIGTFPASPFSLVNI